MSRRPARPGGDGRRAGGPSRSGPALAVSAVESRVEPVEPVGLVIGPVSGVGLLPGTVSAGSADTPECPTRRAGADGTFPAVHRRVADAANGPGSVHPLSGPSAVLREAGVTCGPSRGVAARPPGHPGTGRPRRS